MPDFDRKFSQQHSVGSTPGPLRREEATHPAPSRVTAHAIDPTPYPLIFSTLGRHCCHVQQSAGDTEYPRPSTAGSHLYLLLPATAGSRLSRGSYRQL